jgi:hypothetical protein
VLGVSYLKGLPDTPGCTEGAAMVEQVMVPVEGRSIGAIADEEE